MKIKANTTSIPQIKYPSLHFHSTKTCRCDFPSFPKGVAALSKGGDVGVANLRQFCLVLHFYFLAHLQQRETFFLM